MRTITEKTAISLGLVISLATGIGFGARLDGKVVDHDRDIGDLKLQERQRQQRDNDMAADMAIIRYKVDRLFEEWREERQNAKGRK